MKVRYTAEANSNIAAIATFLRPRSPSGVSNVRADIRAGIARIADNPLSGMGQADNGVRKAVTKRYGFLIYYTVVIENHASYILAIQYPAKDRRYLDR